MKSCTIYKTNKNYIIVTQSICDIGARIIDDPIYVIPVETNIEELRYEIVPDISVDYYLRHLESYEADRTWVLELNQYLKNKKNIISKNYLILPLKVM